MRLFRSFLILSLSFSILCLSFTNSYSKESWWNDYRAPAYDIRVTHKERTTIYLDLPEDFISNKREVILVLKVKSNVYTMFELKKQLNFHLFNPVIKVNDSLFALYRVSVKGLPKVQTHRIKIKTKHLKSGKNKLHAIFKWKNKNSSCYGTCSYDIKEISFENTPPLLLNLAVSSDPQGANIYIGGHFHGETPKDVQVGKGWHNIKIEKVGYQPSIDDIKVFEDDEYFIELDKKSQISEQYDHNNKKYINIQSRQPIYEFGEIKFYAIEGDTLDILLEKTCLSGTGICWKVKCRRTGKIGYVSAAIMKKSHQVIEE